MEKISYNLVFNRKKRLNKKGMALVQVEAYLNRKGASGEATESYNDVRRMKGLGENFIELKNPNSFPLRCPYGNSDTTTNAEVKAAYGNGQYVYSENVWWAGGSR